MSFADYSQTAEDHQSFLILVRHTGEKISSKTFNRTWERIRKLRCVKVPGHDRRIYLRFKRAYPIENNEWGDFQAHRKVLGLLSVGSCSDVTEFQGLFERYKKIKEEYSGTIFNSRLIVFGMNRDGTPLQDPNLTNGDDDGSEVSESDDTDGNEPTPKFTIGSITPDTEDDSKVPKESKREVSKTATNTGDSRRVPLAKAESLDSPSSPENPEASFINGQQDKKSITNSILKVGSNGTAESGSSGSSGNKDVANGGVPKSGRPHSNSLTKDSRGAEVVFYPSTKQCADLEERLQEFAASLFFVLESKRLDRSFERSDKMQLLCTPFEKKDYVGVDTDTRSFKRRCQGRLRKHLADLSLQAGLPGEAILHYQTALDMLKSVNDWLWIGGCHEGLSSASVILAFPEADVSPLKRNFSFSVKRAASLSDSKMKGGGNNSMPNGMDLTREPKSGINPDDIIDKYREALVNYSKFKQAGVIEMEASLKACRILISQRKYLEASDFLQNVVYVNVQSMEEDKVQKYSSLSTLYTQIGFHRKAAFFKRIAAMQCVAPQITTPSWYQCYTLLLQAINGFNISLDPKEFLSGGNTGWPVLQLRVLNELVFSARKMGDPQLIIRHMAFLLHTMHDHLSAQDMREAVSTLESFTANCEGTPHPLAVENGLILPPVPLTHLPTVKTFKPLPLHPHLEPQKMSQKTPVCEIKSDNPFIYSPFTPNTNNNNSVTPGRAKAMMDFLWVAGDSCEVALHLSNPMADDLKVTHMGLITEGVEFDTFPATPSLPAESGPCLVKLVGMPKAAGELNIIGYSTHVFGVRSFCKLKDIARIENSAFQVEVVPSLPHIQLTTSLPKAASFFSASEGANIVTSGTTSLYAGQSQECTVTLQNVGNIPVDMIDVTLEDKYSTGILETVFSWNKDNITSQLPLQPGSIGCFTVCLHGTSDFISNQGTDDDVVVSPARTFWGSRNVRSGTVTSLDGSASDTVCLETVIRVQYSGGEGLEAGYCRHSSVGLSVDIQPSLAFSRWDVQPADSPESCYLVLDGRNESRHDMEVRYGEDNCIVIEPNQVRRFAVKIRRINFPDLQDNEQCTANLIGPVHAEGAGSSLLSDSEALKHSSLIASYVDIQWTIPILNLSGHATLDYLPWSSTQLAILQASPLHWDVMVNSSMHDLASGVQVSPGELVNLDVQLTTDSDIPSMGGALLRIVCYQDNGNGHRDYDTQEKVVTMGTKVIPLSEIASEDGFKHSCDFVFLTQGKYLLEVRCIMGNCDPGSELMGKPDRWTLLPAPKIVVSELIERSPECSRSSDPPRSEVKGSVQCLEERSICFPKENEMNSQEQSHSLGQELST